MTDDEKAAAYRVELSQIEARLGRHREAGTRGDAVDYARLSELLGMLRVVEHQIAKGRERR